VDYSWTVLEPGGLDAVAEEIVRLSASKILLLYGSMGAGKTTLTGHLIKALGSKDQIQSPTYGLVHEYLSAGGEAIYHFDFYRIASVHEALDIGVEEYFDSGHYCFVEWPHNIEALLPPEAAKVFMEITGDLSRSIMMQVY